MQGALILTIAEGQVDWCAAPPLPVEALLVGRPAVEAAELMPRLFSVCAMAQGLAARMALGLPVPETAAPALAQEILRDHVLKLFLRWPQVLQLPPPPMPGNWTTDARGLRLALTGPGGLPEPEDLDGWLEGTAGVAPVLRAVRARFASGEAGVALPMATAQTAMAGGPLENSVAARQAAHPLLARVAADHGRGPLWQAAARLVDALACLDGRLPAPRRLGDGTAVVSAARGLYAVRARSEAGIVAAFERRTPTDHLCAPGGGLAQALAGLRGVTPARVALLVELLDPCVPVVVREAADA